MPQSFTEIRSKIKDFSGLSVCRFFVLAPLVSGILVLSAPFVLAQEMLKTLTVTGRGIEFVTPTQAQTTLGVEIQAATASEAQAEVASRINRVISGLRSRNVSKLQTSGISLSPNYDYSNNQRVLRGYTARNTVSFQANSDATGALLDAAVQAGATTIESVTLTLNDAQINAAQSVALERASRDAQAQAKIVLDSLGLQSQQVVSIQINQATPPIPPPNPIMQRLAVADAAPPTPVIAGEQQVSATVTLQISFGPSR